MNTYDYMYDVLKLRGTIEINFKQLAKLKEEGVPFIGGYICNERIGLALECKEAYELEQKINYIICKGGDKQIMHATDIWTWKYLTSEYARDDRDGGIHFSNLVIYYNEEE